MIQNHICRQDAFVHQATQEGQHFISFIIDILRQTLLVHITENGYKIQTSRYPLDAKLAMTIPDVGSRDSPTNQKVSYKEKTDPDGFKEAKSKSNESKQIGKKQEDQDINPNKKQALNSLNEKQRAEKSET